MKQRESVFPKTHHGVLRNGLKVVAVELPHLCLGQLCVLVRAGPRHETPATHGLSHVCEHMLFRGCGRWPTSAAVAQRAETFMGSLDGATTRDHVLYMTPFRPDALGDALQLLGTMMHKPRLDGLAVERRVLMEEISDAFDEDGQEIDIDNLSRRALFGEHAAGRSIDGTLASVARLHRRHIHAHHQALYVAGNMALAVAGPVDAATVMRQAERAFSKVPKGKRAGLPGGAPSVAPGPNLHLVKQPGAQTQLRLSFLAVAQGHPLAAPLQLLRRVLDDGFTSRLQARLVDALGLAYEMWADVDLLEDHGTVEVGALVSHGKEAGTVKALLKELSLLRRERVGTLELRRAVERQEWSLRQLFDHAAAVAEWHGRHALFGLEHRPDVLMQQFRAVTSAQLREAAQLALAPKHLFVTAVGSVPKAQLVELGKTVRGWRG